MVDTAAGRTQRLEMLRRNPALDVLIIGGGINGAGLFRELALQNVHVALVEKTDFCAGTSAASGRVIHGGLRYLENAEFRLVREALHERNRLLKTAPHYVKPLPIVIPVFTWTDGIVYSIKQFLRLQDKPGNRGVFMIKAGLTLYDIFSGRDMPMPRHHFASRTTSLRQRPAINPAIAATAVYYDARLTYAERLGWELLKDGENAQSESMGLNYVRVVGAAGQTVTLRDEVTGDEFGVTPKIVVNATGAWIDFTNQALQQETRYIGGTKGSHLVLDYPALIQAAGDEMVHFVNKDGRILIVYPFFGRVIVGTTDLRADDPDKAICDEDEVDYLLESVRLVFPDLKPTRSHIVFRFSGVRPLPRQETLTTGQISRDHSAPLIPPNEKIHFPIYSLVGGKWTTFRAFSEQVCDQLLNVLGKTRHIHTQALAIGGGKAYPITPQARQQWIHEVSKWSGLNAARINILLERYGTRAEAMIKDIISAQDAPLKHHPAYTQREIAFIVTHEDVVQLDDLVMRRTLIGLLGELTPELLDELAALVAEIKNWSETEKERQITLIKRMFEVRHGVKL